MSGKFISNDLRFFLAIIRCYIVELPPGIYTVRQWKDDLYIEIDMIITSCG